MSAEGIGNSIMPNSICHLICKMYIWGKILGSDPNLTFCDLIILLTRFHACALKWSEKTLTDLAVYKCQSIGLEKRLNFLGHSRDVYV